MKTFLSLVLTLTTLSCSTDDGSGPSQNDRSGDQGQADQTIKPTGAAPNAGGAAAGGGSGGGNAETTGGTSTTGVGPLFFNQTVSPMFDRQCKACHSLPQNPTDTKAPLSIFSYTKMRTMLEKGPAPENNDLMNKMRGLDSHVGGDRCGQLGDTASPCLEVAQWWDKEFGQGGNIPGSPFKGKLDLVSATGEISGFALDSTQVSASSTVVVYIDRQVGAGVADMTLIANRPGAAGGYAGNHRYSGVLPDNFRNGQNHTAYVYILANGQTTLLQGGPLAYTAWAPTAAGQAYYESTVRPALQTRCASCHVISYASHYASLIAPPPNQGGTATSNDLIDFPAGLNNHPGGNLCGSKAGSPCSLITQWWMREFGG